MELNNELNKELEHLADLLDANVEAIKGNLNKCEKILDDLTDSFKQYQSGLLPEDEKATDEELDYDHDQQMKQEEDYDKEAEADAINDSEEKENL